MIAIEQAGRKSICRREQGPGGHYGQVLQDSFSKAAAAHVHLVILQDDRQDRSPSQEAACFEGQQEVAVGGGALLAH